MNTIIQITIENPSEEMLKALLEGSANKQVAVIKTKSYLRKSNTNTLKGQKAKTCNKKICLNCGNKFKPTGNTQKYCSEECKKLRIQNLDETLKEIEANKNKPYLIN